jgi:hypothetical protein
MVVAPLWVTLLLLIVCLPADQQDNGVSVLTRSCCPVVGCICPAVVIQLGGLSLSYSEYHCGGNVGHDHHGHRHHLLLHNTSVQAEALGSDRK